MKKWRCLVCGYIHEGENPPVRCPVCEAPASKFEEVLSEAGETSKNLCANWDGETEEVGMYLAFSRKADEEGYPEIGQAFVKLAMEEAWHAADVYRLQGKVKSTKENVKWRAEAERGAEKGKAACAEAALKEGLKPVAGWFLRASADEGRHAAVFEGLLKRHFDKA